MKLDAGIVPGSGVLIPQELFVGDPAVYHYSFPVKAGSDAEVRVLSAEGLPLSTDMTVNKIQITIGADEVAVELSFTPWKTGTLSFPVIVSEELIIQLPPVRIASILDRTGITTVQDIRPPVLVPGTMLMLYGSVLATFVAVIILIIVSARIRSWFFRTAGRHSVEKYSREAFRKLRRLERSMTRLSADAWYAALQKVIRDFLSGITAIRLHSRTSGEIAAALAALESKAENRYLEGFSDVLASTDIIRFSGALGPDERRVWCAEVRALVRAAAPFRLPEETDVRS